MRARYILAVLALAFLISAALRWARNARRIDPAVRTWLLIALIFTAIAAWLQWHTS
ncbi:hypothetical protein [Variovorax sp. OV700]|uniref:hypothetical protein n=1 Tax=Variovorax sp. OV700 TaxID=1882826 RepID=UPI00087E3B8E|nr:hypothetical protein [Variovorax sp. OV700]SDJ15322.1 hypothetical protein SAMN05444748_110137 [Variovorax sp. OV700]